MSELKFGSDTKARKQWFTGISFSHPAKLMLPLELWLIENYTKPGDVILDPMAGSGTVLVACSMGRHVVTIELEQKFVDMQKGNWAKIQERGAQLGYSLGMAAILQGDARNLTGILADSIITSPPYALTVQKGHEGVQAWKVIEGLKNADNKTLREKSKELAESGQIVNQYGVNPDNLGNLPYGSIDKVVPQVDQIISSPPYGIQETGGGLNTKPPREGTNDQTGRSLSPSQLGAGKYDKVVPEVSAIISSPPYENAIAEGDAGPLAHASYNPDFKDKRQGYTDKVDSIVTSPPYEGSVSAATGGERDQSSARQREERLKGKGYDPAKYQGGVGRNLEVDFQYSKDTENIGNLKSTSYLEAMKTVYQNCFSVLKDGGLMILVTKNFIRNQQEIRLDLDTIKLCEQSGFVLKERHYRKLTSQSFWRIIYKKKFPDSPVLDKEDILIFSKLTISSSYDKV